MESFEIALARLPTIHNLPSNFMLDPATYQAGSELGYAGIDFYFAGRGGVLGDAPGSVVAAAFIFFNVGYVIESWERSASIQQRDQAANAFAQQAHGWARKNLSGSQLEIIAELAGKVVAEADPSAAPLFAGWRELEVPTDAPAAALHHLNALRELRGAYHGAAVVAAGLTAREAQSLDNPTMAPIHGWFDDVPADETKRAQYERAGEATDHAFARFFTVLNDSEAQALLDACNETTPAH